MKEGRHRKNGWWPFLTVAAALSGLPRGAPALTVDGSLMTNTAFATYNGIAGNAVQYKSSYLASSNVLVCNPVIGYIKTATPTMVMPTGTSVFVLCVINNSQTTSAFNMVVTDKLPDNMSYVNPSLAWWPAAPAPVASWAAGMAGPWTGVADFPNGQLNPFYMRWTFPLIGPGPGRSACVAYTVRVL